MAFITPYLFPGGCAVEGAPPTSIPGRNPAGSRYYPVGLSLEDAMALAWKALSFRMDLTISGTLDEDFSGVSDMITSSPRSSAMSGLVCGFEHIRSFFPGESVSFDVFTPPYEQGKPSVYFYAGLYWPWIHFAYSASDSAYVNEPQNGTHTLIVNGNQYEFSSHLDNPISVNSTITIATERSSS